MALGQFLLSKGLVDLEQLEEAQHHQKLTGGSLPESLVALAHVSQEELDAVLDEAPLAPDSIQETGLDDQFLLNFLLKAVYVFGLETAPQVAEAIKLPDDVVQDIFDDAKQKKLVEVLGLNDAPFPVYRYSLTSMGREWAIEALGQCQYTGPAPVPFAEYQAQVYKQSIGRERVDREALVDAVSHLVVSDDTMGRLGPAVNSGRSILLHGAPGNGKTAIAEAAGKAFEQAIYLPHCVEVDGQIIKFFDPSVHEELPEEPAQDDEEARERPETDPRWVRCRRPVIIVGGELTMEMLDLSFDPVSKYYEAPPHIKAVGGVFIIDDFGRQRVHPQELLNRWILPLERRVDYLTLHTGKKLEMPFDELVIFSTNAEPKELMDSAALRRIPHKFHMEAPTENEYREIFQKLAAAHGIEVPETVFDHLFGSFYPVTRIPLSGAHPKFLLDHVHERCRFEGVALVLTPERVHEASRNMMVSNDELRPRS